MHKSRRLRSQAALGELVNRSFLGLKGRGSDTGKLINGSGIIEKKWKLLSYNVFIARYQDPLKVPDS